ncbi:hypothetical protein [Streptomyces prunicolor]|uniref:Uncharacterized protein n=1 Tax=Streptomyces prunicolor TaxID=67348 RepID=A0ABU4FIN6_9ACTN|nr:hypothetical protein [Streptomyces prunicolor]MDV7220434.1 hypothetical protein [Streptomyces prunicolor]
MSSPMDPRIEAAFARVLQGARERADVLGPPPWEPVWKRPRKPLTKAEKKNRLRLQRKRLQQAGHRRFFAGQSRRPRPRRNRIGSAAARRDARARSRLQRTRRCPASDAGHSMRTGADDELHRHAPAVRLTLPAAPRAHLRGAPHRPAHRAEPGCAPPGIVVSREPAGPLVRAGGRHDSP